MESQSTTDADAMNTQQKRSGLIQHQVRPEVKEWIEEEARKQERSQRWFVSRLIENAYKAAKQGAPA